jgi:hypothetical protein
MTVESDDIHMDETGDIFVADLTEYVPTADIGPEANPPIVGLLNRNVSEGVWRQTRFERAGWLHYGLIASLAAVPVLFVLPSLLEGIPLTVTVLFLLLAIIGTLLFQLFDIRRIRHLRISWTPSYAWYALGWFLMLGPLVYLYRRHKHVGLIGS